MTDATGYALETHVSSDGYRWRYRRYAANGPERGRIVCLHGIQSHAGWYPHSCQRFAAAGFGVSFLDRRGSGTNEAARGDAPSFRRLIDDVAELLLAQRQSGGGPIFLLGISWGGKLAVGLPYRHPGLVDGLMLLCPGLCPRVGLSALRRLTIFGARLVAPRRAFPIPLDDPELFTATPRWQQFIRDDPLALRQASARFLFASSMLDFYLRRAAPHVRVPALLLLAGQDRIIDNARTRAFVERFGGDKQIIEYPDAHHTLEFEPNPDHHLADILDWLDRRVPG